MGEKESVKTVPELSLLELSKNARILQRQLKIMKGLHMSLKEQEQVRKIILTLEQEFQLFQI